MEAEMSKHEVWGFPIERCSSGRNIWPDKLKEEAVRRIREDEATTGKIATEIGTNKSVVSKWFLADRKIRGELAIREKPVFASVQIKPDEALRAVSMPPTVSNRFAKLEYGNVRLEFPVDISERTLTSIIRAIGHAT
jgi:transposase-like protein